MGKSLRDSIRAAKELGPDYYVEVKKPLSTYLEPCVIQQKLAREGRYPVIFCPRMNGSKLPLVTNLFGSFELLGLAIGCDPRTASRDDMRNEMRRRMAGVITGDRSVDDPSRPFQPRWVPKGEAPVKEVVMLGEEVDLGVFPIPHHAEGNVGPYITIGMMISRWPGGGAPNAGVYRHMVMGRNRLGAMISPGNDGAYIARGYAERGELMEVALVIGHHSAVVQAAIEPKPAVELNLAGALLGEPLAVTDGETVDLPIPADAEVVIEGVIGPSHMSTDGPFSESTGYYGHEQKPCYVIEVKAITMRKDAIWHDLDPSHREHRMSHALINSVFRLDTIKSYVPSVIDITSGGLGTYIKIHQTVPGEGRRAAMCGAFAGTYGGVFTIVVDDDIDIYNEPEVLWAITSRTRPDEDFVIIPDVLGSHLHPTSYNESRTGGWRSDTERGPMNTRLIIDATRPLERPFEDRILPWYWGPHDHGLWKEMKLEDYLK